MKLPNEITKVLLLVFALIYGISLSRTEAGVIKVANTAENPITMRVIPGCFDENSTYCWSCFSECGGLDRCRQKTLLIPSKGIGSNTFSLVGTEGGILFNGICSELNAYKNYEVVFFDTPLGIGCRSTEL